MLTIIEIPPTIEDIENGTYNFQTELTPKLDDLDCDFSQSIINEIVLWKINRYTEIDNYTFAIINKINKSDRLLDPALTGEILMRLLRKEQKGIRLAIASTILRFKNPHIYQIIDQRVYRFLYGKELKYSNTDLNEQINIYLDYLHKLKEECNTHKVPFEIADRIFYTMDKKFNFKDNIKY
jgi:hypothetical protein